MNRKITYILIIVGILVISIFSGCLFDKAKMLFQEGQKLQQKGDYEGAIAKYKQIITDYADSDYAPKARNATQECLYEGGLNFQESERIHEWGVEPEQNKPLLIDIRKPCEPPKIEIPKIDDWEWSDLEIADDTKLPPIEDILDDFSWMERIDKETQGHHRSYVYEPTEEDKKLAELAEKFANLEPDDYRDITYRDITEPPFSYSDSVPWGHSERKLEYGPEINIREPPKIVISEPCEPLKIKDTKNPNWGLSDLKISEDILVESPKRERIAKETQEYYCEYKYELTEGDKKLAEKLGTWESDDYRDITGPRSTPSGSVVP